MNHVRKKSFLPPRQKISYSMVEKIFKKDKAKFLNLTITSVLKVGEQITLLILSELFFE